MINTSQLSKQLKLHRNTISNYIKEGMPCIKLKRKYLFDYEKVVEWLENREGNNYGNRC